MQNDSETTQKVLQKNHSFDTKTQNNQFLLSNLIGAKDIDSSRSHPLNHKQGVTLDYNIPGKANDSSTSSQKLNASFQKSTYSLPQIVTMKKQLSSSFLAQIIQNEKKQTNEDDINNDKQLSVQLFQENEKHLMNVSEASLSAISTIIGGGIVGLPFAFYNLGFIVGLFVEILFSYLTRLSCEVYLAAKDLIPGKLDSLYEIGYMVTGRSSIFLISLIISVNSFGLMMIYFNIFAKISQSVAISIFYNDEIVHQKYTDQQNQFFATKTFYVIVFACILFPFIIRRELKELKIVSLILSFGVFLFILVFVGQLISNIFFQKEGIRKYNKDKDFSEYIQVHFTLDSVKGISMLLVAFAFQQNLFPMLNSLKTQTTQECLKACDYALGSTSLIYFTIGILGVFVFGSQLEENVLLNVGNMKGRWESYLLRIIFLIVLGCHVPFIFFSGKESVLIFIDEIQRNSISKALQEKIQENNKQTGIDFSFQDNNVNKEVIDQQLEFINEQQEPLQERRKSMAYKEMATSTYLAVSIILFLLEVLGAALIDDIGLIFEFVSAVSISCLSFIFPGGLYILSERKFASRFQKLQSTKMRVKAWILIVLGIFSFIFFMTANITEIIQEMEHK